MTTIKDIAEYTGVSATTVSNVIHGRRNRVSEETVARIQKAIEELGYVPNLFARSLVSSSSRVIALINFVPTVAEAAFSDEAFQMGFLSTMESSLKKSGYYLMFRRVENVEELKEFLQNWNLDGIFVTGACDAEFIDELKAVTTPVIYIDSYARDGVFEVGHDDYEGGRLATSYLISKGHRRIVFASTVLRDGRYMEHRYQGYLDALAEAGIEADPGLAYELGLDPDSCRKTAESIASHSDVTAVLSTTDIMAAGLMAAFKDMGMSLPEDYSFVGFDDSPLSHMITPRLTTVRQDMREKARTASELMLRLLGGGQDDKGDANAPDNPGRTVLPVELVIRDSVTDRR